ncbi:MAG: DegT/DnrJ/EryC1/StrS aminotransferase family protein [Spirochaetaceae bacterium]|nr:MAG: DegT/DnrJ/EryC1/StrS aminotransferase family protein [Spirochaetaceae bacterium]
MSLNTEFIPFARPDISEAEVEAVQRVLRSGWLTTASETATFEREFAAAAGVPHALAVNSATSGLHLALEALGVGPGDRVVLSPYTFTSTAEVIRYLGADPLFVDVDPHTRNICPTRLAETLEREKDSNTGERAGHRGRIAAVIAVHIGGVPCDMAAITMITRRYQIPVVEDAAHCLPWPPDGPPVGTEGDVGIYSFYATKPIAVGEGGMVVTRDDATARRIRLMRLHGIDRDVWNRYHSSTPSWQYDVVEAGYKYNLPDTAAAIGRVQLARSAALRSARAQIAARYRQRITAAGIVDRASVELPVDDPRHSHHLFILSVGDGARPTLRDAMIARLTELGVGTSVHYRPLHLMTYYRTRYHLAPDDFPRALVAYHRAISLPLYSGLSEPMVERICDAVIDAHRASMQDG